MHYAVNHSENGMDHQTSAHTQTSEGLWSHVKDFLPDYGTRDGFCGHVTEMCKLDKFIHFLFNNTFKIVVTMNSLIFKNLCNTEM